MHIFLFNSNITGWFIGQPLIEISLYVQPVPAVQMPREENPLDGEGDGPGSQVQEGWHGGHVVEVQEFKDGGEPEEGEHGDVLRVVYLSWAWRCTTLFNNVDLLGHRVAWYTTIHALTCTNFQLSSNAVKYSPRIPAMVAVTQRIFRWKRGHTVAVPVPNRVLTILQ